VDLSLPPGRRRSKSVKEATKNAVGSGWRALASRFQTRGPGHRYLARQGRRSQSLAKVASFRQGAGCGRRPVKPIAGRPTVGDVTQAFDYRVNDDSTRNNDERELFPFCTIWV
jgi:hypothetical protein